MATDVVDDLHAAEEAAGELAAALGLLLHPSSQGFDATRAAISALESWADYCRPGCQFLEHGECASGEPDLCGCPCGHADAEP